MEKIAFDREVFENGMTYSTYLDITQKMEAEGKTSGENQSEFMVHYTKMNVKRMSRWNKTWNPSPEIEAIIQKSTDKINFLIITEAWCGDAAHNIPMLAKLIESNPNWNLKFVWRDEDTSIIDAYLTDGGRSIPKLVAFNEDNEVLFTWGPRPEPLQDIYLDLKDKETPFPDINTALQTWYNQDKGQHLEKEFIALINKTEKSPA